MSMPPQLIGIKRRRYDEPVDVLYLEKDRSLSKRRFTDFVFQRLRTTDPAQPLPRAPHGYSSHALEKVRPASSHTTGGAPLVQATSPGAEVRDAFQRRTVRAQLLEQQKQNLSSETSEAQDQTQDDSNQKADAGSARANRPPAARRFHLSRDKLTPSSSKHAGGIRKHKHHTKSDLATFVEKHGDRLSNGEIQCSNKRLAIDRLILDSNVNPQAVSAHHGSSLDQTTTSASAKISNNPQIIQPFVKAPAKVAKTGNSMREHPSTWDHDSDQLADELAAFAMEISEEDSVGKVQQQQETRGIRTPEIADADMDVDGIFVYETYLRVPRSELSPDFDEKRNSIGMLVIEEQDEELWQTFAEDEEDSDWDEDGDSNAEDNPRNDYPEAEVSSEDEYGHSAYKYRHGASDDEEYDLEDAPSSDDDIEGL